MSRIDDIKSKLEDSKHVPVVFSVEEVQYLVSKLEQVADAVLMALEQLHKD